MLNLTQKNKILNLLLCVVAFVLIFELIFSIPGVTETLCNWVESTGPIAWIIILFLQFIQVVFVPIPAYFITLTSMKMFPDNLILLFILTLLVTMMGVTLAYLIGVKWGKKAVIWASGSEDEYDKWLNVLRSKKTNIFYFLTILLPIFPDDIMCLIAGSIKMNFWWFLFCNLIGRSIGLVTFMFVFKTISGGHASLIAFASLLVLLIIGKILLKRKIKHESIIDRK